MNTLQQLYAAHGGKVSDKWSSYLAEYERIFAGYRERPVRLLEIGVQNGGSMEIWAQYFPNAQCIVGCDIDPACAHLSFDDPRIAVVIGDAASSDAAQSAIAAKAETFDIIIDDGSHRSGDIVKAFARYFPLLTIGGVYVAEDLHCGYWGQFEGGLYYPYSSMAFFKRLADAINHQHWSVGKSRAEIFGGFFSHYGVSISEEVFQTIRSVQFSNSMCAVHKDKPENVALNDRIIAGSTAQVDPRVAPGQSLPPPLFDQSGNPWAARAMPPDEELPQRLQELATCQAQVKDLEAKLRAAEARCRDLSARLAARDEET